MRTGRIRTAAAFGMALSLAAVSPVYAVSPEFSRTNEEWARLRDNKLEYDEIEGLIHEYNHTVQANQISLNKFRQDYGDSKDDVSNAYRDMANEILGGIEYPESDSPTYVLEMSAIAQAEIRANNYLSTADSNVEDSEIYRLNYESAEKTLAQLAQSNMISYYTKTLELKKKENELELARVNLEAQRSRAGLGMATNADVLNADESLKNAESALLTARQEMESTRQKLTLMCGWKYGQEAELGTLPEPDTAKIASVNLEADILKATENNYALKVNLKKLSNSVNQSTIDNLNTSIEDNRQNIAAAVKNAYNSMIAAQDAYNSAKTNSELLSTLRLQADRKFELGMLSRIDYLKQKSDADSANIALEQARFSLLLAIESYEWAVDGLAAANAG